VHVPGDAAGGGVGFGAHGDGHLGVNEAGQQG
jgi:hypothetical protein